MTITWNTEVNAPGCPGEILGPNGQSVLIQTDWDQPGVARTFGWSLRLLQKCKVCNHPMEMDDDSDTFVCDKCECTSDACDHRGTDGTVDCPDCGCEASTFISAAGDWLRNNDGATAEDPGYFSEGE